MGRVRNDARDVAFASVEQLTHPVSVICVAVGQHLGDDHSGAIHSEVQLLPTPPALPTVLGGGPFAFSNDREPGAITRTRGRPDRTAQVSDDES